jgi:adenine-specific DNA methylase
MTHTDIQDKRLIEAGFPCHQVGAETQRERDTGKAPPVNRLHVWWARRPLTPSRAAILASLLPADTDPDHFLKQLGIQKPVVTLNGQTWTLVDKSLTHIQTDAADGTRYIQVDNKFLDLLDKENDRREKNRDLIRELEAADETLRHDPVLQRWKAESQAIPGPHPGVGEMLPVEMVAADPAHVNQRIAFAKTDAVKHILGKPIQWDKEDLYGYTRAFASHPGPVDKPKVVLDPTSGGGSIPFESQRLGHKTIANELNPVATVILHATLEYPSKYGLALGDDIQHWGNILVESVSRRMAAVSPFSSLPHQEKEHLKHHCRNCPDIVSGFDVPEYDHTGILYCRQVTCPHCQGHAPLLNTCWLNKSAGDPWGVKIIPDGNAHGGTVRFETYRATNGKGPMGEDPDFATVTRGVGYCIHCRQAIDSDEIKRQARGESGFGKWKDRLYCVVAVRFQPKLDKHGQPQRYKSGEKKDQIKTEKIRFFRPPNADDLAALDRAETQLADNWEAWDRAGLIPTETFPQGNDMRPVIYGMTRWCDMFTPRQLLGHLTLVETLNQLKPQILESLGQDKGRAVVTYLQFAIEKGVDYNSRQTRWHYSRGSVIGTFGRHDFSLKWTFGEMIFTGPQSGAAWGLDQVLDAYKGICELTTGNTDVTINNGTAANLSFLKDGSVDLVCMDPPYYNNVQYAELSDFYYVWQSKTLKDLYPGYFSRRLTNKQDEAVANPDRDGSTQKAKTSYEQRMKDIFFEARRVLKPEGLLNIMFTHKSQDAWETLTHSLIDSGWIISAAIPVESETQHGIHTKDTASAISSIFITCRKRVTTSSEPAAWTGFGGTGVQTRIRQAVAQGLDEFASLNLNPVDEMVAGYGRALRVLSEQWPVIDGDEPVGPVRAMTEASRVVAEHQIQRITKGALQVTDLSPEAAMALTLFGIYGLMEFPFGEALNLSHSLNIELSTRTGGYTANGRFIGINTAAAGSRRANRAKAEDTGFHAPLLKKGSKLRLATPEERREARLIHPQTEWDILHGVIMAFREGDVPVARAYLDRHAPEKKTLIRHLLTVWAAEVPDDTLQKEARAILFGL